MARLLTEFNDAIARKAAASAPGSVRAAVDRFGWSTRDLAERLGVSERTARRYRQQDRIPARRADEFRRAARSAATERQRSRIASRGLSAMNVHGRYRVSKSVYTTPQDSPVRIMDGNFISGASMREVFDLEQSGDPAEAEAALAAALGEAYGNGMENMSWDRVDSLDYTIR